MLVNFIGSDYSGINLQALEDYNNKYFEYKRQLIAESREYGSSFNRDLFVQQNLDYFNASVLNLVDTSNQSPLRTLQDSNVVKQMYELPYSIESISSLLLKSVWFDNYHMTVNDIMELPIPQFDIMFNKLSESLTKNDNLSQQNLNWNRSMMENMLIALTAQLNVDVIKKKMKDIEDNDKQRN